MGDDFTRAIGTAPFEPAEQGYKGRLNATEGDVVMYAGGLLAALLILGLVLVVTSLAMVISEPRAIREPRTRENPSAMTQRLRAQTTRDRRRTDSGRDDAKR